MPARLTDAEMLQYRSTVYGVASTVGHIPRMHMGRLRWTAGMEAAEEAARSGRAGMLQLPPEALEAGRRISSAGEIWIWILTCTYWLQLPLEALEAGHRISSAGEFLFGCTASHGV